MNPLGKKLFFTIGISLLSFSIHAQSLEQAKKLYSDGQYEEAKPVFERLVKQAPSNSSYNHWYGVCCYETGDLETAAKHLQVGVKRKVQESFRYLAELYIQTYKFEEAAGLYEEYISILSKKKENTETFEKRLQAAETAQRMLDRVEAVQVIDSVIVDKDNFLSAYLLSEESGSVLPYNEFFLGGNTASTVYINQKGDKVYYGQLAENGRYSLFTQSKLMEDWGDEKKLPANINPAEEDNNFPFALTDGVTIYYASKGNGTIGGYDLFVTRYNTNSDTYLAPEQLGMPFNSPFNDYMIVFDEAKNLGWFASDRFQPEGKVCLYLFIPNDFPIRVEGDDTEMKRERAILLPISSTWRSGANYEDLIELAYQEMPYGDSQIDKDFEFVISNQVVYYKLDEIQSPEARNHYSKVVDLNRQIKEVEEQLEELRLSYIEGNRARKEQLEPAILQAEQKLNQLLEQPDEIEKKARNAEISYLRKNR